MTEPEDQDKLVQETRRRGERHRRWLREGDPSVARRLAQIGVLGWIIVVPMLIGVFAGRWLDQRLHSGVFWTAPLMLLGLVLGCWSAWKWMQDSLSIFLLAACLVGGTALGIFYFQALRFNAGLFARGGRALTALALALGRFAVLGGVLALASRHGAGPLLATAAGVMLGRFVTMRRARAAAP